MGRPKKEAPKINTKEEVYNGFEVIVKCKGCHYKYDMMSNKKCPKCNSGKVVGE